ncbi:glycosyltransferase 87 family protein [Catellatospora vulcania]|uniref:glycosyltransferase 87 family protein n=1 Tax=Catellatospora vulcania TaxID=1460450 RepID=UPI0012D3C059|nr:glycosyltransferase 87 family protein [Catellatospora vulcania]
MVDRRVGAVWSVFGAVALVSSVLVLRRPPDDRLSDLHIYYGAIETVQHGQPLYGYVAENGGPFTYPPFAALLMQPMTLLAEPTLRLLWLALTVAAIAAIAAAAGGAFTTVTDRRPLLVAVAACALLLSAPAQSNLRFGQVSVFIVLLALVDAIGLTPARHRGVLIGLAAAIKLTPLLFVVFLLVAKRPRDAARAVATFAACALAGAAFLPADSWTYWTGTMLQTSRIGNLASLGNQSLHGMLMRAGMSPETLPLLWAALVALICGVALLRARRIALDGEPVRAAVLVGCATVAASPVSWTHHQLWTVLAAMLMIAANGVARRVAGGVLLVVMVLSLGSLLGAVSMRPGVQFVFENARSLGVVAVCLAGVGGLAVATARSARPGSARVWLRTATTASAALACIAILPLPAGADPTFKAYDLADTVNPRYFFYCRTAQSCADAAAGGPVHFGTFREPTKVRVNGVVDGSVARLEFTSAPGGPPREIPLVEMFPGQRTFSFRLANIAAGRLVAYGPGGEVLAVFTDSLNPA